MTSLNLAVHETNVDPQAFPVIEWAGFRVVTTETLASGYGCEEKSIRMNLSRNLERFEEGKHYFMVTGEELKKLRATVGGSQISSKARAVTLWTEKGAARMSKIVDTDEAWSFFERLEDSYFHPQETSGLPMSYEAALEDLLVKVKENRIVTEQRDRAIKEKLWIADKREATAMATASAEKRKANALAAKLGECKKHATIKAVQRVTGKSFSHWPMKKWCAANGMVPKDVPDETYGSVKSWPAEAWKVVNNVDLRKLF
ncbi:TPA: ORF6N domain-containing protein [Klebsiella oxytoca]|uniref:ORF6N domain-containing protein n=1 Tax=Klebsiella/Raoultella group TaxID=2890311 RepID=UPI000E2A2314|nr:MULTISPECIES: ORF6N domain-containing protein [Klebsiella/Raoultella group]HEJ6662142.1 ORF6N domain-containing protein [Klebsiella oxytoca]MBQ4656833.1 ORF6N domain-containing protein [Klebsiella michiganensis]MBQ4659222.1 ORF6N domain-containing protein [Klebsiella michiganensis]QUC44507.1 ORF6N domain-containing protein [Klebsiella pneumoniae]RFC04443.1 phage antirepressor Ant [Klebsiella michiganensis]